MIIPVIVCDRIQFHRNKLFQSRRPPLCPSKSHYQNRGIFTIYNTTMNNTITSWDNDYARLARAASQLRTTTSPANSSSFNSNQQRQGQVATVQEGINRLGSQLSALEGNLALSPAEAARRKSLLDGLRGQLASDPATSAAAAPPGGGGGWGGGGGGGPPPSTAAALRRQDDMIDELAVGVGRLKNQTNLIHQEASSHVRLLDEIDSNVDLANRGLEEETRRAMRLREEKSVWKLHLIIVGLSVLLFLLILMGLS